MNAYCKAGSGRARVHELYRAPLDAQTIERRSFGIIDAEAPAHAFSVTEWQVARRLVHAAGDFGLLESLYFSPGSLDSGVTALRRGAPIYADSRMLASGLSLERLRRVCPDYASERIVVHVADEDVAQAARNSGLPRAIFAVRKARGVLPGAIACFGNSPVGLLELSRLILEEGVRPAMLIAMPVGFVHVLESKEEALTLQVPQITLRGRRGGSPLAVAALHALAGIACEEGA